MISSYQVKSPVLLISFNRPDIALKVFNRVREVKPRRLYIAVDGPRHNHQTDTDLIEKTKQIYDQVDWDCKVFKRFRASNLGCKYAVSDAISWFFQNEEEGIILEDDTVPVSDFFRFCDELLPYYRNDSRIGNITGTNLQFGRKWGTATYYFSQYSHIWGWAGWRRVWEKYDVELSRFDESEVHWRLKEIFPDPFLAEAWMDTFRKQKSGQIDSWDYQFNFMCLFENMLCATPNSNLVSNIGFRQDATHTKGEHIFHASLPTESIDFPIVHPRYFLPEKEADYFFLQKDFFIEGNWKRYNKKTKRLKRWLRSIFLPEKTEK